MSNALRKFKRYIPVYVPPKHIGDGLYTSYYLTLKEDKKRYWEFTNK